MHIDALNYKAGCCGCTACANSCPKHCITMCEDDEGFVYPMVDEMACIDCGLCVKTCPLAKEEYKRGTDVLDHPLAFAAKHKEENIRKRSTSGGAFTALSDLVLDKGGIVCGAAFNESSQQIEHIFCKTKEERDRLRGSKYVQSCLKDAFPRIKTLLAEGVLVLFTGTPCQCAGLFAYLKKDYENLIVTDILCHSVPSPLILRETLKKYCDKVDRLTFRNKSLGWRNSYEFKIESEGKTYIDEGYLTLFFKGLTCRPSCHECHFTNMRRPSDITIGDYWNINHVDSSFEDALGVSCLFANTEKGRLLIEQIRKDMDMEQTDLQPAMQACTTRNSPKPQARETFWTDYHQHGFDYVYRRYGYYTRWETFRDRTLAPLARKMKIAAIVRKIIKR